MKYTASIASALAVSAILAPSVMATTNTTVVPALPAPSSAAIVALYKNDTAKFQNAVITGFSFRQDNQSAIDHLDSDLFNVNSYAGVPAAEFTIVQKALLCELVSPGSVDFNGTSKITNAVKFNDILLAASLVGQQKNNTLFAGKIPAEPTDDKAKEAAKKTKTYLDHFCRSLTSQHSQFLIANSSHFIAPADASAMAEQNDVILTTLDLCKAHLGDARTLAASVGATVAATALFLAAFL